MMTRKDIQTMQANATKALKKAVKKAIARHEAAGVPAVVWQDGKVVRLPLKRSKRKR
jgi:hypothetical protein